MENQMETKNSEMENGQSTETQITTPEANVTVIVANEATEHHEITPTPANIEGLHLPETEKIGRYEIGRINPRFINIDWSANPRTDYGKGTDEYDEMKNSIKEEGIQNPIEIYKTGKGTETEYHLAHGFRRMMITLEALDEGADIKTVPFKLVANNMEHILRAHLSRNMGKELSDVEKGEVLLRLKNLGYTDIKELTKMAFLKSEQKAYALISFAENASKQLKDAVIEGKLPLSAAKEIVKESKGKGTTVQNEKLAEAEGKAKAKGSKKISAKHVSEKVALPELVDSLLALAKEDVEAGETIDIFFYEKLQRLVDQHKKGFQKTAIYKAVFVNLE